MVYHEYYSPSTIFSTEINVPYSMIGRKNFALAKAFYYTRYNAIGDFKEDTCDYFGVNAGAVQFFNKKDVIVSIPHSALSQFYYYENILTSYGHSERILMRDVLDEFIKKNNPEIIYPSHPLNSRSADQKDYDYEILRMLTINANFYRNYLTSKNIIIKMWSERPACNITPDKLTEGRYCSEFIDNIFTDDSQYGYITNNYSQLMPKVEKHAKVKNASSELRIAYQDYLNKREYQEINDEYYSDIKVSGES